MVIFIRGAASMDGRPRLRGLGVFFMCGCGFEIEFCASAATKGADGLCLDSQGINGPINASEKSHIEGQKMAENLLRAMTGEARDGRRGDADVKAHSLAVEPVEIVDRVCFHTVKYTSKKRLVYYNYRRVKT